MNPYTRAVARHLTGLDRRRRAAALDDLEGLLAEGVEPADLGAPEAYAAALRAELGAARGPRRAWAPEDPRLFVPRTIGWGWRVNAGALAVRLGWLRPDDADADVLAEVPTGLRAACRLVPAALAAATGATALRAVRSRSPVPVHWGPGGVPDRIGDPRWLLAPAAVAAGAAGWAMLPARGEQVVTRPALAASAAATCALVAHAAAAPDTGRPRPWLGAAVVLVAPAVELVLTLVPIRVGLGRLRRGLGRRS